MSFGHVVLALLADGERHGYDIKRQHDLRFPAAKAVAPAQVYASLDRLQRDGWVSPASAERAGGPDRTAFALTAAGRAELEHWLAEVEAPAPYVTSPLSTKVTLALLVLGPAAASRLLRRQHDAHLDRMRDLTRAKTEPGASLLEVLAADYAIDHLDADLRWIDTALARATAVAKEIRT